MAKPEYTRAETLIHLQSIGAEQEEIDAAMARVDAGRQGHMNYEQALERAKTTPVMRPHWKLHWLTFENGRHFDLHDDGSVHEWCPLHHDLAATDWCDAPRSPDEP